MSNEQMAQSILQFTGGKGNIRIVSNCMTPVSYTHLTLPTILRV